MAEKVRYNNILESGRADETLTYTRYVKDESSGKSTKEMLDEKVNKTDEITTAQIANKAVTTEKLNDSAVTEGKLAVGSVTTPKVANENITTEKLADSSVTTEKLNDKSVTTDKMADESVDNSKLSPSSVSYDKIKDKAVITEKLNDRAVTTEKVEDKAITNEKLGDSSVDGRVLREANVETKHLANESVTTNKVATKSITKDKLADNSVDTDQVVDGSITNPKLSSGSVDTGNIKDKSITNDKVADDTLTREKLDPELRKAIDAATGLPDDLTQMIQDVDIDIKNLKEKDDDLQGQLDNKQEQITANDNDIELLQTRSTQMEESIKGIAASGGASQANAVTYDNKNSLLDAVNVQGAVDELQTKKFDVTKVVQDTGDNEDKVMSQKAVSDKLSDLQQNKASKEEVSAALDTKVDKEEGKSLTPDEINESFKIIENDEFIHAITDAEDRVLFGIRRDTGKPYFPLNEMYHVEQNEEFFAVWLDAADHVLLGIRRDGQIIGEIHAVNALKQVVSQIQSDVTTLQEKVGTMDSSLQELLSVFSLQDNEEYLAVETDADGKVLSCTNADGSHYLHNVKSETIPTEFEHVESEEYLHVETDKEGKILAATYPDGSHYLHNVKSETLPDISSKVDKEDGKSLIDSNVAEAQSAIEDPEGRMEITTDAEGKVLGYRDQEGTRHEKKISVNDLSLSEKAVKSVKDNFATAGIKLNPSDWSNKEYIHIPIPRCASLNIISSKMPTAKSGLGVLGITCDIPCDVEFNDMEGNYFRKPILLSAQGDSTMAFEKKNLALDFFVTKDDRDNGGDTFSMKFGDWVAQDGFHLKAYYQDAHRGISAVSYMVCEEMAKNRNINDDRPFKYLFASKYDELALGETPITEFSENFDTGAKCFPQGFPVIVYQNGEFYGVYSWQLKKHRDNYFMNKKNEKNIHLDGILGEEFWKGNIDWSSFEIRNPKSLYYQESHNINGKDTLKYNGDYCYEIMGEDSPYYDVSNKDMKKCAKVKNTIIRLSQAIGVLNEAVAAGKSSDEIRETISQYFMPSFLIDYILEINVMGNTDATNKNWQWTTWDALLWTANAYDHDLVLGAQMLGNFFGNPGGTSLLGNSMNLPTGWIIKYYEEELKQRYGELRNIGIFEAKHITNLVKDWRSRIGYENWVNEYEKWDESPCNRPSCIDYEHWALSSGMVSSWVDTTTYNYGMYVKVDTKIYKSLKNNNVGNMPSESSEHWEDVTFDETKTYSENDICGYGKYQTYLFKCVKTGINIPPLTKFYNSYPYELGTYDSVYRVYDWLNRQIQNLDKYFKYNN